VAERVRVRKIDDDEGRRLLRIIRRGTGPVVTWRRAQTVLSALQPHPGRQWAERGGKLTAWSASTSEAVAEIAGPG